MTTALNAETTTVTATPERQSLLTWYIVATIATAVSGFVYLFALRKVVANDTSSGLDALLALYWMAGLFAPVVIAIKGVVLGLLLWGVLTLMEVRLSLRDAIAATWFAEPLLAMPQLVYALAALARGATAREDLFVPLGLDAFWAPTVVATGVISHVVNIFLIAWACVLVLRLRKSVAREPRPWAVAFAVVLAAVVVVLLPVLQLTP
jgi:hypothetical protein